MIGSIDWQALDHNVYSAVDVRDLLGELFQRDKEDSNWSSIFSRLNEVLVFRGDVTETSVKTLPIGTGCPVFGRGKSQMNTMKYSSPKRVGGTIRRIGNGFHCEYSPKLGWHVFFDADQSKLDAGSSTCDRWSAWQSEPKHR